MVIKQKYSAATAVAAYTLLFGTLILGWVFLQQLPLSIHSFKEPTLGSPIVFAQEPAEEPTPEENIKEQLASLLQAELDLFADQNPEGVSVFIKDLDSGATATLAETEVMTAASIYKLFIANEALKLVDDGKLLRAAVIDGERDWTLSLCLEMMITVSDNDCGVLLQRITGAVNAELPQLKQQGFNNTDLRGFFPESTAADVARFYENLYYQEYLSRESNLYLLDLLSNQQINDRLPQGLPDDVTVMHKTGDLKGFAHDGGIVRTTDGQEYLLVIMTGPDFDASSLNERYLIMAELTSRLHEIMTGFQR